MNNLLFIASVVGAGAVLVASLGAYGAEYAAPTRHESLGYEPHIMLIPVEAGRTVLHMNGSWMMKIQYDKDGIINTTYHEHGLPNHTIGSFHYVGETFIADCHEEEDSTRLILYHYRGTRALDKGLEIILARYDFPVTEPLSCKYPDILRPYPDPYDIGKLGHLFDPDHPYMSGWDAREKHIHDTYVVPIRDAAVLSGPFVEALPAVPFTEEASMNRHVKPKEIPGRYSGWIRDIWHHPEDDSITVAYNRHEFPLARDIFVKYQPNQTFVYGCYDHVEPTLLYLYQYRGTQMINGTPKPVLAGLDVYSQTPIPCTDYDLLRSSVDAYDPAKFEMRHVPDPNPPFLPDREETLAYDTYTVPLQHSYTVVPSAYAFPASLLAPESYLGGLITDIRSHPDDSITVTYGNDSGRVHIQDYQPGQTFVFSCHEGGDHTSVISHRYMGTEMINGEEYFTYTNLFTNTDVPMPCSMPELAVHAAEAYDREWFDINDDGWSEHDPDYKTVIIDKPATRADYVFLAGTEPVYEPRVIEPLVDPPALGYIRPQPFGFVSAQHHPEDDSVTLNYTDHGRSLGGIYSQTYRVNQTFAYGCGGYFDDTRMYLYQYRGTNTFEERRSLVLVHFEVSIPEDTPCAYPDFLEHTVDIYDAGDFDRLYDLDTYRPADGASYNRTTWIDPIRHAVVITSIYIDPHPLQTPDGEHGYGYWIANITHSPDDSITVNYRDRNDPDSTYARSYDPGQSFLISCLEYEGSTALSFFNYRGTEMHYDSRDLIFAKFGAYTRAPMPCTFPDFVIHSVDTFDTTRFDLQYDMEWYKDLGY